MLSATLISLAVVVLELGSTRAAALPARRATVCNGYAALCSRSYGNVTFVAAHDSFAFSTDPLARTSIRSVGASTRVADATVCPVAADQHVDIPTQLSLGVRMLQAQAHVDPISNELHFCHTSCVRDLLPPVHPA
jgi:hypothetical protein